MTHLKPLLIAISLFLASSASNADFVYKCQNADGKKVFSGFPCGPNAIREEYRNLSPARKADENLPPRQGELLNEQTPVYKLKPAIETDSSKTAE
ncbi:DUF4124 domain-containing protein [Neptunomonas antarctica]|uniref:DUF4124 domain-containing protein n=1 Tax=Neptunomonas antarctica TaxID=619304 RepID=A0A1N7JFC0_9GAMM|nr:DUF4124 domain-containing protein [Neptunomonas antarctica]SIS48045.1 protein of unknown function [Neptunomonas antarctica]